MTIFWGKSVEYGGREIKDKRRQNKTASSQLLLGFIPQNILKIKGLKDHLMSNLWNPSKNILIRKSEQILEQTEYLAALLNILVKY